ncbi:FG-GAP-like repeat-containing protein [Terriglobus tenax]|uniref:FG-GAP-like repeat-containing protein n=1 Tax=Terriglobus tenax TaxID=1111115 RepID=UPI0021DF6DA0|nr:FG-GAP-like repeat-containing protein [Terriglobus tenax]
MVSALPEEQAMSFAIVLPLRNQAELNDLLKRLYDPSSPDYRKFLSVAQFTEQFGPTAQDYESVASYARANGFSVAAAPANRMVLSLTGTVAQVESAFGVHMNYYQHPTENRTFFSPDREPSLALPIRIAHISGLNNFYLPQPQSHVSSDVQAMAANVTGSGPGGSYLGSDMRAAYYGGTTLDGNGQVVGLLEFDGYYKSDVDLTFSNAGQTYNVPINNVLLSGMTSAPRTAGGEAEVVLDIVQAIGMAPGLSQVRVYIGANDAAILNSIASENIAKQIGCSWSWRPDDPDVADPFFQEMAAQGQSFFAASGDNGAFSSSVPFYFPQEDAYVTAVGGTHLTTNGAGGSWASEVAWNNGGYGTGGGVSPDSIGIPSWQTGIASAANGGSATLRNVPDVAMEGDFDNYMCSMGTCRTTGAGTSFAAPRWAGFMAMVNQQAIEAGNAPAGGLGFINPSIYAVGAGSRYATDMHDVTSGNNQTAGQSVWYSAVAGYDLVTGWGSANGQSLIDELAGSQVPGFWLAASNGALGLGQGATGTTTITVTNAGGFTGDVNLAITSILPSGVTASWGTNPTTSTSVLTFVVSASALESSTPITITGTSGNLSATTTLTLVVHQPTFTLSAAPTLLPVAPGNSVNSTVSVAPKFGFNGSVSLAASGLPTGVTASWGTNPTTGTSVVTFAASANTPGGTYPVTITGTSGSITATTTVSLLVQAPSFTLYGSSSLNVGQNSSVSGYFYVSPAYGFNSIVNFSVSGLPAGVSANFSPASSISSTNLILRASSAVPGQYPVTVTGTSGSLTSSITFTLNVYEPSFTLSASSVNIGQGSTGSSSVYVNGQYGFNSSVNLSVSGLPSGVSAIWNPNPTTSSSSLTLMASSSVPTGQYTLTVAGRSGSLVASTTLTMGVYEPTFTLSGSSGVSIGQGGTTTSYVYVNPQYGFGNAVMLSVAGLPAGVTASFVQNPTTGSSTLNFSASSSAAIGQYPVTISGTSGTTIKTMTLTLGVYAPTFTLSGGGSVNIPQGGGTGNGYLYVNGQYGFSNPVTFSVSGLPSGVTANFSPNPATYSSTVTFSSNGTAAAGQYPLTITGTYGSRTASLAMTLIVYEPTYTLSANNTTIGQGTSTNVYVYANSQYGYNNPITLSLSSLPAGVTATISPNPTTYSSSINFVASSSAAVGAYPITVTGTSGATVVTTQFTLTVATPAFTLSGYSVGMGQGSTASGYVYMNTQNGFSGSVTYSATGLPTGLTASFSNNPSTNYSTQIVFTASSSLAPGQYPVTITGVSGSLTASTTITVTVYAPSFTLSGPYFGSVNPGTTATGSVYISSQYGFTGAVNLVVSGLPSGVTASFSQNPATSTSVLTITASDSAVPGTASLTITGTSGTLSVATTSSITINQSGFSISSAPNAVTISPGGTAKSSILVNRTNGFSGSVSFTATGLPAGVTSSFSPAAATNSTVMTLSADSSAVLGAAVITVTGTSNGVTVPTSLTLSVAAAGSATTTGLSLTANGGTPNSLVSGTMVSLTATVQSSGTAVKNGEVVFCETTGACDFDHRIASALLSSDGKAVVRFLPGPGDHAYKAAFLGAPGRLSSSSDASTLNVTASVPTRTLLTSSGSQGNYTLSATVTGQGRLAPGGSISFVDTTSNGATIRSTSLSAAQNNISFDTTQSAIGNTSSYSLSSGDFNGDGIIDLVTGNSTNKQVVILLGQGDGKFTASGQGITTASQPVASAVGDFNGDGNLDLALAYSNANVVAFYLGNGDGTFTPSSTIPTGSSPIALVAEDFNRDGKLDLAVANNWTDTVNIYVGNGDMTFVNTQSPQTGDAPRAMVAADFNRDGLLDLATVNQSGNTLTILLGSGDGTFTPSFSPATGSSPSSVATADFNGDGVADLAVANSNGNTATILLGVGDGTFTTSPIVAIGTNPGAIVTGDFNGDGRQDLAVTGYYQIGVGLFFGQGDGTFPTSLFASAGSYATAMIASDLNGDGVQDFAVLNAGSGIVTSVLSKWSRNAGVTASGISPFGQGAHQVKASYGGDSIYQGSASNTVSLTAQAGAPVVTVTPSAASVFTQQPFVVTVKVAAGSGYPDATGTVTLSRNGYSARQALSAGTAVFNIAGGALSVGNDPLTASYAPDPSSISTYTSANGNAALTVADVVSPTVTVTPSASTVTTLQSLSVAVGVSAGGSNPVPTGTVTLTSGTFSAQQALTGGVATFNIASGMLAVGNAALTASYVPDATGSYMYKNASGAGSVTVTAGTGSGSAALAMTVSPATVTDQQSVTANISVAGASGAATPTGTVVLTSGSYRASGTLVNGAATFTVAGAILSSGSNTLTATYLGDSTYASTSGMGAVLVAPVTITAVAPSPVNRGSTTTSNLTFNAGSTYSGTLSLSCSVTSSPAGAQNLPICSLNPSSVSLNAKGSGSATVSISTSAATSAALSLPWQEGGLVVTAFVLPVMLGWRRRRIVLPLLLLLVAVVMSSNGCAGGKGVSGGGSITNPGTTTGSYTITVTGTDSTARVTAGTTVVVTVQ